MRGIYPNELQTGIKYAWAGNMEISVFSLVGLASNVQKVRKLKDYMMKHTVKATVF